MARKILYNPLSVVVILSIALLSGCATPPLCPTPSTAQLALLQDQPVAKPQLTEAHHYYQLSVQCLNDQANPQSLNSGVQWLRLSATLGDPGAQYKLASAYLQGIGVPKNINLAFHWMLVSAQQGNRFAQASLAYMYQQGIGVPADQEMADYWYQLSRAD